MFGSVRYHQHSLFRFEMNHISLSGLGRHDPWREFQTHIITPLEALPFEDPLCCCFLSKTGNIRLTVFGGHQLRKLEIVVSKNKCSKELGPFGFTVFCLEKESKDSNLGHLPVFDQPGLCLILTVPLVVSP